MADHDPVDVGRVSSAVALPIPHGDMLRLLGPSPEEAAIAVDPLVGLDESVGPVRSFVAGVCDAEGRILQPAEIMLVVDPATVTPNKQVPAAAVLELFDELPALRSKLPTLLGFEILERGLAPTTRTGPLLYCRKKCCVFVARTWQATELPNVISDLDELVAQQRSVVAEACELAENDPVAAERLAAEHACARCSERQRCYPADDGYAYVADRLVAISAASAPLVVSPLGEWRFDEVCRIVGGMRPSAALALAEREDNQFESWRGEQGLAMERAGPPRLLSGETDGRELLEVARVKLALVADILAQLDAAWRESGRPHLCWNEQTVRVAWRRPPLTPAACWGFQPVLRKIGLQPNAPFETPDGRPLAYPPAFSDETFLPRAAADAARYFDEPRQATLFVKKMQTGDGTGMRVLLENLGVAWDLFETCDAMHVAGDGWNAVFAPAAERDPDDDEGLPFHGRVAGDVAAWKQGAQFDGVECRWYPRFGEAVDLHAVGVLLLQALLAHEESDGRVFREALADQLRELWETCRPLPLEQRDEHARNWVIERCEIDAPAALWTRRNLLYTRDDRNATRLDAFPAALWQAILVFGLRLTTNIPGFSFCDDRGCAAPRLGDGLLLPLVEVRGLIALLDDQLFGRTAAAEAATKAVAADT